MDEAKRLFEEHLSELDAVVMDASLTGGEPDTLELTRWMRERFEGPVVACSSNPPFREEQMQAGCNFESPKEEVHVLLKKLFGKR